MHHIRLPLAALALTLLAGCQSAAPTAPAAPRQSSAPTAFDGDSVHTAAERGGNLLGSGN